MLENRAGADMAAAQLATRDLSKREISASEQLHGRLPRAYTSQNQISMNAPAFGPVRFDGAPRKEYVNSLEKYLDYAAMSGIPRRRSSTLAITYF